MRSLIAGVGYQNLRDLSAGPVLITELQQLEWPAGVEISDLSFGPIAVVQWLQERPGYYQRMVFVSAVERGRKPGDIQCYRWHGQLPDTDEIQWRVAEAVMGVISLDNLLIITQHFAVLPRDVVVVEIEPEDTGWGLGFTPCMEIALGRAIETIRRVVLDGYHGQPT